MPQEVRAETVRTERRRTRGATVHPGLKLAIDDSKLDRKNYNYRLANDTEGRIQQLEGQDWDIAPEQALYGSTGEGTVQSKHAGSIDGRPFKAVLMRKPKPMHDEDQAEKQTLINKTEREIVRGENKTELSGNGGYTPAGNSIA